MCTPLTSQVSHCTVHLKPLAYCLPVEEDFALYHGVASEGILQPFLPPFMLLC